MHCDSTGRHKCKWALRPVQVCGSNTGTMTISGFHRRGRDCRQAFCNCPGGRKSQQKSKHTLVNNKCVSHNVIIVTSIETQPITCLLRYTLLLLFVDKAYNRHTPIIRLLFPSHFNEIEFNNTIKAYTEKIKPTACFLFLCQFRYS